jgi:hypothetical protein
VLGPMPGAYRARSAPDSSSREADKKAPSTLRVGPDIRGGSLFIEKRYRGPETNINQGFFALFQPPRCPEPRQDATIGETRSS